MPGFYLLAMRVCGVVALLTTASIVVLQRVQTEDVFLIGLGIFAGWLRFRMAPSGYLSLSPIAFFLAVLIVGHWSALVVAVASVVIGAILFARATAQEALQATGEEFLSLLGPVTYLALLRPLVASSESHVLFGYVMAVLLYIISRLALGATAAFMLEGIGTRAYLIGATKNSAANLLLLASIAFGLHTFLYNQFGYLALVLVTVALVEFYHPWKLLSEQDEVLFANLAMVAQAIDFKDPYTARHSWNVSNLAVRIARAMGLPENEVRKIRIGALMHDIGKIGVSAQIIRKPTRLDANEEVAMRAHPVISADIMQPIELLEEAAEVVRHHHEHLDGSGYPSGLKGEMIPIGSRVILVADAFDAMISDRPYRRGRSKEEALRILKDHAGRQFDKRVVEALETILPRIQASLAP